LFAPEHLEGTFDHAAEPEHDPEAPIVAPAR
jgi:hypothetical protein